MELYGLKDKYGAAIKVEFPEYAVWFEKDGHWHRVQEEVKKDPEPQFKVGDWAVNSAFGCTDIGRIEKIEDNGEKLWWDGSCAMMSCGNTRLATPQEIESHLIKIAEEKGFKGNCKFRCTNGYYSTKLPQWDFFYLQGEDALVTHVVETSSNRAVYCKGQWAEIVHEKKKLPKTKEEFKQFLKDYSKADCSLGIQLLTFLSDYED